MADQSPIQLAGRDPATDDALESPTQRNSAGSGYDPADHAERDHRTVRPPRWLSYDWVINMHNEVSLFARNAIQRLRDNSVALAAGTGVTIILGLVAVPPAYEAIELAKWTAMKDFVEHCRDAVGSGAISSLSSCGYIAE